MASGGWADSHSQGRYDERLWSYDKAWRTAAGPEMSAALSSRLCPAGHTEERRRLLDELTLLSKERYVAVLLCAPRTSGWRR